ncbi:MAG TPA: helix-turn-helix domain-containing protein [Abditibacteriaceae bacterium]
MRTILHPPRETFELSNVLHALSDPIRLRLVVCLAGGEEQQCSALYGSLPKSTLSHHFKVLREAGILSQRAQGTSFLNSLRRDDLDARFPGLLDAVLNASREEAAVPCESCR